MLNEATGQLERGVPPFLQRVMELVSRKKSSDGDEVWRKIIEGSKTIRVEKGLIA